MTSFSRSFYRSRQVLHALRPRVDATELEQACSRLSDGQRRLFFSMELRDQRHALEVARRASTRTGDRDVLVAALLHDCGKGPVPLWLRIAKVVSPGFVRSAGRQDAAGWRGAAYRLDRHVALSASLATEAGCSPGAVRLIGDKPEADERWKAELLREADDAS